MVDLLLKTFTFGILVITIFDFVILHKILKSTMIILNNGLKVLFNDFNKFFLMTFISYF